MSKQLLKKQITLTLVLGMMLLPNSAGALPQGGVVTNGNGSYSSSGNQMDVTGQGNMSVKWDSFNVAANETVNFTGMQAILNYVSGKQGSEIFGTINGPGVNVFLINPNGILFGKTAQVNVGSLTASTKDLGNVDNVLNNFANTAMINDFGQMNDASLVNMGNIVADSLRLEGGRIVLDTDNVKLNGSAFDGQNAEINGDYANDNVILGYTGYDTSNNTYAGQDKEFTLNNGEQIVRGYLWVENVEQLQALSTNTAGYYALKNDIDAASSNNFVQIGKSGNSFKGNFDGLDYSIKNLTIDKYDNFQGLFWQTSSKSKLRNFTLDNVKVTGYSGNGAVAGANQGLIENVHVKGSVTGAAGVNGGIVGINAGIIKNVTADVTVSGGGNALGGIAGQNQAKGSIENALVRGSIEGSGRDVIGGIVGDNSGKLNNVHNEAKVCGDLAVGGIVGQNKAASTINTATNSGDVEGTEYVGGIMGYYSNAQDMLLKNTKNSGNITGGSMVGGIVGSGGGAIIGGGGASGCVLIQDAENNGAIVGVNSVGGIMGGSGYTQMIDRVINTGTVKGESQVGGILGNTASAKIGEAINWGQVIGESQVGGIVGFGYDAEISDKAFYATTDKEGNRYDISKYNDKGIGKTYAELIAMQNPDSGNITPLPPEIEESYENTLKAVASSVQKPTQTATNDAANNTGTLAVVEQENTEMVSETVTAEEAGSENTSIIADTDNESTASENTDNADMASEDTDNEDTASEEEEELNK